MREACPSKVAGDCGNTSACIAYDKCVPRRPQLAHDQLADVPAAINQSNTPFLSARLRLSARHTAA